MNWFQTIPPAICYFLFNQQFFRCVESILKLQPLRKRYILLTFCLNYGVFIFCSVLNLHLIANWIVFLFLLLAEQLVLYRQPVRKCTLFALLGSQLGLTVNVLFRSMVAILLDVPLVAFDNSVLDPSNLKRYPILLGFLVAGVLFLLIVRFDLLKRLELATEDGKTLLFLLALLIVMYFYLCMNLTVYYIEENNLILKLWSMKSAIFVIVGEYLSIFLSIQMGQISAYRIKSQELQEQLIQEQSRELELRTIAATDPLTGCENRFQVMSRLEGALSAGNRFALGFVDLNGLKAVNDNFGHEMGDRYIQAVAMALNQICGQGNPLYRYGGDEFLLLLFDTTVSEAVKHLQRAQRWLEEEERHRAYPFSMGISYGVASSEDGAGALELIKIADDRMYQMKLSRRP